MCNHESDDRNVKFYYRGINLTYYVCNGRCQCIIAHFSYTEGLHVPSAHSESIALNDCTANHNQSEKPTAEPKSDTFIFRRHCIRPVDSMCHSSISTSPSIFTVFLTAVPLAAYGCSTPTITWQSHERKLYESIRVKIPPNAWKTS